MDIVTTRSVLIYVEDKRRAFEEFFRVLKPGGRISLFEPINRFNTLPGRPTRSLHRLRRERRSRISPIS